MDSQDVLVRLVRPMEGQPETLVRSATLVNEYKDELKLMDILGSAGALTSVVFFDKGQSVCFDGGGNPISGSGKFAIVAGPAGQRIIGWLGLTSLSVRSNISSTTSFRFLPRNPVAKWGMTAVDFVAINPLGRWGAVAAVCVVALVIVVTVSRPKSSAVRALRSLHAAIRKGNSEKVAVLLATEGVVNSKDAKGWTPLHLAANHGQSRIASVLLKSNAEVNAKDHDGGTPLHYAAFQGHKEVVELLLASQAEVNATDKDGDTPMHLALEEGHQEVAEMLRQHGGHE
jgi:hypothetical protein